MALTKQKLLHKRSSVVGRILAPSALTYGEIAVNFSSGANNSFLEIKKYDDKTALYFEHPYGTAGVDVSGTSAGYFFGSISGITEYYDGLTIKVRLRSTYNSSWNTLDINGLGSKIIWYRYNSRMTSHFGDKSELVLTYRTDAGSFQATGTARGLISGTTYKDGWVAIHAYYNDNNDMYQIRPYYARYYTGDEYLYAYKLCALDINDKLVGFLTSGGTGSAKPVTTKEFKPDKIYWTSEGVAANTIVTHASIYESVYTTAGTYTFNGGVTTYKTIYVKGKLNEETGLFKLSSGLTDWQTFVPYNQTALTLTDYFDEGWYYIRVGRSYSTANYFYLDLNNPLFYFDGTNLIEISPFAARALSGGTALSAVTSQSAMTANSAGTLYNWLHIYENGSRIASFNGSGTTSALTSDNKVYQSNSTTSSFRPIMLGYQTASTIGGATLTAATTQQVYTAKKVGVQPSTGKIVAAGGFALSADTTNVLIGNGGSIEQDTLSPSVSIANSGSTNSAAQSVVYGAVTGGTKGHSVTLLRTNKIYSASTADSATIATSATTASSASTAGKLSGSLNIYKNGTLLTTYDGSSTLSALTTDTNPSVTAGTVGTGVVTGITASGTSNHAIVGIKTTLVKVASATTADTAVALGYHPNATTNSYRNVWFSYEGQDGKLVVDTDFQYNPGKNSLKVSAVTTNGTNQVLVPAKDGTIALLSDIDGALAGSVNYKGATATLPSSSTTGDMWITTSDIALTAAQSATGAAQTAETGDFIIARESGKWDVVQKNIDGAVTTTATTLTDGNVIVGKGNRTIGVSSYTIAKSVPSTALFTDSATTYTGHYTPSSDSTGTTSGARITAITKDGKGHIISITTAATDNTDTATTETGHYSPTGKTNSVGVATAGSFLKQVFYDSKGHVTSATTGTALTSFTETQLSYNSGTSVSTAASSVMTGLTVSNHAITYGKTNKIFSASTTDSARTLTKKLTVYNNGVSVGSFDGSEVVSALTTDEKIKTATATTKAYIVGKSAVADTSTGITHANAYMSGGALYSEGVKVSTTDTKVTDANSSGKTFLLGHSAQGTNATAQTYTNVYMSAGTIAATEYKVDEKAVMKYNTTNQCIDFIFI